MSAATGTEFALSHLDNRPMSPLQRRAAILVSMGEFISGYDLLVMGAALIYVRPQFDLVPARGRTAGRLDLPRRHGRSAGLRRPVGPARPPRDLRRQPVFLRAVRDRLGLRHPMRRNCSSRAFWSASASAWISRPAPPTSPKSRPASSAAPSSARCRNMMWILGAMTLDASSRCRSMAYLRRPEPGAGCSASPPFPRC